MSDWWIGRSAGDANCEAAKRLFQIARAIMFGIVRGAADPPRNSSSRPLHTNSPPRSPRPGPMSIKLSAARMICSSCSTTSRVLPLSRKIVHHAHQPADVARMQTDARLVHDEECVHERCAEAGGEIDPLHFAAAQACA